MRGMTDNQREHSGDLDADLPDALRDFLDTNNTPDVVVYLESLAEVAAGKTRFLVGRDALLVKKPNQLRQMEAALGIDGAALKQALRERKETLPFDPRIVIAAVAYLQRKRCERLLQAQQEEQTDARVHSLKRNKGKRSYLGPQTENPEVEG